MREEKIKIAVSMGDPAGIGAEIILKSTRELSPDVELVIYGDKGVLAVNSKILKKRGANAFTWSEFNVVAVTEISRPETLLGNPSKKTGECAYQYLLSAAEAVMTRSADALVTAPVSKQWVMAVRKDFRGHTELLAELSKTKKFAMMFSAPTIRVSLVTTHLPLAEVPKSLKKNRIVDVITLTNDALVSDFDVTRPSIAVAGLNPHAGEGGSFGLEDVKIIAPAIEQARKVKINAVGPLPADAMFAIREKFDGLVCMYHDQALTALKALHFSYGVNLTLGLPFVRTSPDHGTAFDIAGRGIAQYESMLSAINLAVEIVKRRRKNRAQKK